MAGVTRRFVLSGLVAAAILPTLIPRRLELLRLVEIVPSPWAPSTTIEDLYMIYAKGHVDPIEFTRAIQSADITRIGMGMLIDADFELPDVDILRKEIAQTVEHRWLVGDDERSGSAHFVPRPQPGAGEVTVVDFNFLKTILRPDMKWIDFDRPMADATVLTKARIPGAAGKGDCVDFTLFAEASES